MRHGVQQLATARAVGGGGAGGRRPDLDVGQPPRWRRGRAGCSFPLSGRASAAVVESAGADCRFWPCRTTSRRWRAVLEGVAFGLRQILDGLREHVRTSARCASSAAAARDGCGRQIPADVFGLPIHMLVLKGEATGWGAAVVAGVGADLRWSIAAERSQVVGHRRANPANRQRHDELLNLFRELPGAGAGVCAAGKNRESRIEIEISSTWA